LSDRRARLIAHSGPAVDSEIAPHNKATLAVEALLDGEAEELTRKAIELAKGGDLTALLMTLRHLLLPMIHSEKDKRHEAFGGPQSPRRNWFG
jgi:hypothetical protein